MTGTSPAPRPAASTRLAGLDALRGLAALCVLYFHILYLLTPFPELKGKGYLAVDFFFMLSGYVMARTYEARFAKGYGAWTFMWARYRRLWPVMTIGGLIGVPMVAIELHDHSRFLLAAAPNLLLLPSFATRVIFPINVAAWSIFAELVANLIHALILWRLRSGILLALAIASIPMLAWLGASYGTLDIGANQATWMTGIPRALFSYSIGILLWRRWREQFPLRPNFAIAMIALPLLLLPALLPEGSWAFDLGFILLASPLLIASGLAYTGNHWAARWLGMLSFPLYAVNMPLLHWAKAFNLGPFGGFALAITVASVIAVRMAPGSVRGRQETPLVGGNDLERSRTLPSG